MMIEEWLTLGARWEDEKPCWKSLLIAIDAKYGGANPALADSLLGKLLSGIHMFFSCRLDFSHSLLAY